MQDLHTETSPLVLSPLVRFVRQGDTVSARVKRGESETIFNIDENIYSFLSNFRRPTSLADVAMRMEQEGYQRANILAFGKQIMKTPLLQFCAAADGPDTLSDMFKELGLTLLTAFKDKKFEGVYRVANAAGDSFVLKLLKSRQVSAGYEHEVYDQLRNEFDVLHQLGDKAPVVKVHQFFDAPYPRFSMEYLDGVKLTDCLGNTLELATRRDIAVQILTALARFHDAGFIHGDVHTSNFMVCRHNRVVLIDLDCSFRIGTTEPPRIGGAAHFLPPERTVEHWFEKNAIPPDRRSDIYQTGVTLHFVLTGRPPFRGETMTELVRSIRAGEYTGAAYTKEKEPIPGAVSDMLAAMLTTHPSGRPDSLHQVLTVFSAWAQGAYDER